MSARNLVRNLRDSGALPSRPAGPDWRSAVMFFGAALTVGAIVYLGIAFALPGLMQATARKPPPVTYAKVETAPGSTAVLSSDAKLFTRTDELACIRYGEAAKARAARAKAKEAFSFDLGGTRYAELGGKLVCEAQTRPMRLCDPAERARFIARSLPYFKEVETMASMFGASMNSPAFALMPNGGQASKELFGQMASDTLGTIAAEHRKVAQAFRDLALRGLVKVEDFGGGIFGPSAAVKVIFKDMPPVEDVCSPA